MAKTKARLNRLAEICSDIAQIALASVVLPFLLDKFNLQMVLLGLITALSFWILSLFLSR